MRPGRDYGCLVHAIVILWSALIGFLANSLRRSGHAYIAFAAFSLILVSVFLIYKLADYLGSASLLSH